MKPKFRLSESDELTPFAIESRGYNGAASLADQIAYALQDKIDTEMRRRGYPKHDYHQVIEADYDHRRQVHIITVTRTWF